MYQSNAGEPQCPKPLSPFEPFSRGSLRNSAAESEVLESLSFPGREPLLPRLSAPCGPGCPPSQPRPRRPSRAPRREGFFLLISKCYPERLGLDQSFPQDAPEPSGIYASPARSHFVGGKACLPSIGIGTMRHKTSRLVSRRFRDGAEVGRAPAACPIFRF